MLIYISVWVRPSKWSRICQECLTCRKSSLSSLFCLLLLWWTGKKNLTNGTVFFYNMD